MKKERTAFQSFCLGWMIFSLCFKVVHLLSSTSRNSNDRTSFKKNPAPAPQITEIEACWVDKQSISNGDTMEAICQGREFSFRLCGVDAPEPEQPLGIEARDYLRSLIPEDGRMLIFILDREMEGHTLAEVTFSGSEDLFINETMVRSGMAWYDARSGKTCTMTSFLEPAARSATERKLGVHADPNAIKPWEWREAKRTEEAEDAEEAEGEEF